MSSDDRPEDPADGGALEDALDYASRGWPVLPLHDVASGKCSCGNSSCGSPGKHPCTQRGWKDATTDPQRIGEWWARWPTANIGISTEHLLVLDVDIKAGRNGREALKKLTDEHGELPETPEVRTGSGGGHIYLKPPAGVEISCSTDKLGPGLDVRARGGYVVAPPSLHASGEHYAWLVHPDEAEIAEAPAWLIERLNAARDRSHASDSGGESSSVPPTEDRRVGSALYSIPPENRDVWMLAGMALKTALGDRGWKLFDAWSMTTRAGNYDLDENRRQWASWKPGDGTEGTVNEGSLFHLARKHGWTDSADPNAPKQPANGLVTRCLRDIDAEEIDWVWPGRIARGKVTQVSGDPGLGKTWLALHVAACLSAGLPLPDHAARKPATILIASAEDDPADTLRPRLEAAGADLDRVHVLDGVYEKDEERGFTLADIDALEAELLRRGDVELLIIDPISAYMGAKIDSHNNTAVRAMLGPLVRLAQRTRVAILAITHMSKGNIGPALYRSIGSIAFVATVRIGLMVVQDPDDKERRVLVTVKSNLSVTTGTGLAFELAGEPTQVNWLGPDDRTADELLGNGGGGPSARGPSKRELAQKLILDLLADGPVPAKVVEKAADLNDIGKRTLNDAKKDVGARSFREGDVWYWTLEPEETPGSEGRPEQGPEGEGQPQAAEHAEAQPAPGPGAEARKGEVDDAGARGESVGATVQGPGTVQACNLASLPCNPPQDPLEGGSGAESVEEGPESKVASAATFPEAETKPARGRKRTSEAPKGSPRASKRRKKPRLQGCNPARGREPATLEGHVGAPSHGALDQAGPLPDPPQDQEKGEAAL